MISKLRRRLTYANVMATMAVFIALPAAASADHQAQMAATSSVSPGCQPKGVFAQPAPGGGLAAGTYAYVVVATVSGIEVTPCPAVTTSVPGGPFSSVSLVWNAAPGATGYKVYRAPVNTTTGAVGTFTEVAFPAAQAPGCPRAVSANANGGSPTAGNGGGTRCDAHDVNPSTAGAQLAVSPVGANTQAGAAVDLKLTQCVDYGGARSACPFTPGAIDDPQVAWDATNGQNALRTDDLHFPSGLNARPDAGTVCKLSDPAGPSLLGDPAKHGSADAFEDTCPAASLVGNATTLSRTQNSAGTYSLTRGDIYLGEAKAGEAARLYVVLRPNCSAGAPHPFNPGGPVCSSAQGLNDAALEVSKEFLAMPATSVRRADGTYGIDVRTINAETDGTIPPKLDVLTAAGTDVADIPVQVHQLTQTLFGTTSQNTPDAGDDRIFLTLPTYCGDHSLSADKTTYAHTEVSSASTSVPITNCVEFTPEPSPVASPDTPVASPDTPVASPDTPVASGDTPSVDEVAPDLVAPALWGLGLGPRSFRAGNLGGSVAASQVGTRVSYRLSEAATLTFRVQRVAKGRRSGARCVAPTKANRQARRCVRYLPQRGSFTRSSPAGADFFTFTGRLRRRALRPASYRLVVVATDAAGNSSAPKRVAFRIVRR